MARALKQSLGIFFAQRFGVRLEDAVIRRRRAQLLEVRATVGECAYETRVIARAERVELGRRRS